MRNTILLKKLHGRLEAFIGGRASPVNHARFRFATLIETALLFFLTALVALLAPVVAFCNATRATIRQHRWAVLQVPAVRFAAIALGVAVGDYLLGTASSLVGGLTAFAWPADAATSSADEVVETFKQVYLDTASAIPDATALTAQLNRTRKVKGAPDGLTFHVKLETGGAVANVSDGGMLPRPSRPRGKKGKSTLCHTYTTVAVGGQSVALTKEKRNAFVSNLEEQLEDGMTRVQNDLERQYNSDGRGILGVVLTVVGAPTYGIEDPYGVADAGPGTMLLIEDMDVAILSPAGVERGRSKIATVDVDADTFTTADAIAGAAIGDYVVLCNDNAATGDDRETNFDNEAAGILAVCKDDDTFEDISAVTHRRWRATVVDGGAAALTERKAAGLDSRIVTKCGKRPTLYYTTEGIKLDMMDSLSDKRRYSGETMTLKGGYEGLVLNNRTVLTGAWCPKGHFFALNTEKDSVGMVDVVKMGYVDLDGSKLHRVEGRHLYRADLYFPHQAIWFLRNRHGVINNLTDDSTIVR